MPLASHELVQIVDQDNRPRGSTTRGYVRKLHLWHRASYIFVRRSDGCLCVQQRTLTKDIYPGAYDLAAGGVVDAGESTHIGAQRELAEELGIRKVKLKFCFDQCYVDERLRVFGGVYLVDYDGALQLQASEVADVVWMTADEALALSHVTPDSRVALLRLVEERWL